MKSLIAKTALGFTKIHKHQAVLVLGSSYQRWHGVILHPCPIQSFIRYNQDGKVVEKRVNNKYLVPVDLKKLSLLKKIEL
jgi:hypothetical protein